MKTKTKLFMGGMLMLGSLSYGQGLYSAPGGLSGFNTLTPGNRVEITTGGTDPYFGSANGSSGLRFTNMTSGDTPGSNPGNGVLAVDANGDIILVTDNVGTGAFGGANNGCSVVTGNVVVLGNNVGGTSAQLTSDREIPMNSRTLLFSGTGNNSGDQIIIGTNPVIQGKLNAVTAELTNGAGSVAGSFESSYTGSNDGIGGYFKASATKAGGTNYAITGQAANAPSNFGISMVASGAGGNGAVAAQFVAVDPSNTSVGCVGVSGQANGGNNTNYGVAGTADSPVGVNIAGSFLAGPSSYVTAGGNTAVKGQCTAEGDDNYGGFFNCPGQTPPSARTSPVNSNWAVYGAAPSSQVYGANWANSYAGYFDGDLKINGRAYVTANAWTTSDMRIKTNITDIRSAMDLLGQIKPKSYKFNTSYATKLNLDVENLQYGVIAQELEKVLPELVSESGYLTGFTKDDKSKPIMETLKAVNYVGLIPILIAGVQEQQSQLNTQQQQIDELKEMVRSLAGESQNRTSGNAGSSTAVKLSDKDAIVLNQNVPNPFAESTVISYNIPTDFTKAQLIFSTDGGSIIKVINITEKGLGSLNVFADDLSHGVYTYSLVIDGKTIDTKKMAKQ